MSTSENSVGLSSKDYRAMRTLLRKAVPFVCAARNELFIAHEINGVIHDTAILEEVASFDSWLDKAAAALERKP